LGAGQLLHTTGRFAPRHRLLESLATRTTSNRSWNHTAIAFTLGSVNWLEGDFVTARKHLLTALENRSAADPRVLETAFWVAPDPVTTAHTFLALTHMLGGHLECADAEFDYALRRCDELGFPRNAHNRAHTLYMKTWVSLEASQLEKAATLVARLRELSEQSGLDLWQWVGRTQHATVKALAALAGGTDAASLTEQADKLAHRVDASRRMSLNSYLTFHDGVIGRLLVAAGRPEKARERLDMSLRHAQETGMRFYDAEVLRVRAHTFAQPEERRTALADAIQSARHQGATLFELRCLVDSFDLLG
jgi:tetratricopeptide (TPR) repeat protein